jgi:hypothetical protein
LFPQNLGDLVVCRFQTGHELQVAHGLFGLDHAACDLIDLSRDELGFLPVDRQLAQRMDRVLEALDLQA